MRLTRLTRLMRLTRLTRLARLTRLTRLARVTQLMRLTRLTRLTRLARPIAALAVLVSTLASATLALAGQSLLLRAPFEFRAGDTQFAPGTYVLVLAGAAKGGVSIQSEDGKRSAVIAAHKTAVVPEAATNRESGATPVVSFRAYGDRRFLAAIQGIAAERWDVTPSAEETALTKTSGPPKTTSLKAELIEKN
jgi:hypothetical protein